MFDWKEIFYIIIGPAKYGSWIGTVRLPWDNRGDREFSEQRRPPCDCPYRLLLFLTFRDMFSSQELVKKTK